MSDTDEMIEIESITSPNWSGRVNRAKYVAMRDAFLPVLPTEAPGLAVAEAKAALLPNLSQKLFPRGGKAGWWLKAVQLDLEAKGLIERGGHGAGSAVQDWEINVKAMWVEPRSILTDGIAIAEFGATCSICENGLT